MGEIGRVPGCQRGSMHLDYGGNLRVRVADWSAQLLPMYLDARKGPSGITVEDEDLVQEYSTE